MARLRPSTRTRGQYRKFFRIFILFYYISSCDRAPRLFDSLSPESNTLPIALQLNDSPTTFYPHVRTIT